MNGRTIIENFALNPSTSNMDALIDYASSDKISNADIALLAKLLAKSGKQLKLTPGRIYCDIPSTGGPSSLSTLICPLVLTAQNISVSKLGVPGRPAGGIDVLYQIPGYKIFLSDTEILDTLDRAGYCHFLVNDDFAWVVENTFLS